MFSDIHPLRILLREVSEVAASFVALLPNLVAALVVLAVTAVVAKVLRRLVGRMMRRLRERPSLVNASSTLASTLVWVFGLLVAATIVFPNLTPANLLAGLGLGSLVVGLAFKDIFENYLAGILILVRRPMRIGDDIECEGLSGQVETITIRDTYLRQRSGELLLLPNSFIYKNPTRVLTDRPERRIALNVGVAYGTDLAEAGAVLRGAFEGLETVDQGRRIEVFATSFGDFSIDFVLRWWAASSPLDELRSRDEVLLAVDRALARAGIEIPFPQRTLSFGAPVPIASEAPPPS